MKKIIIGILAIIFTSQIYISGSTGLSSNPDFAYPKQIVSNSNIAITDALKSKNSDDLIQAIVQYSIAKSSISPQYFPVIISKIDSILSVEKNITCKNILYSYEAELFLNYKNSRNYSVRQISTERMSRDYDEWSEKQINDKIVELITKSIANENITSSVSIDFYKKALRFNDFGKLFYPSIFNMLANRAINMSEQINDYILAKSVKEKLASVSKGNIPAEIFYATSNFNAMNSSYKDLIRNYYQFSDNQYSGLFLSNIDIDNLSRTELKQVNEIISNFMIQYPNYSFMRDIMQKKNEINRCGIFIKSKSIYNNTQKIGISVSSNNVSSFSLTIYQLPESFKSIPPISQLKKIGTYTKKVETQLPFLNETINMDLPPLPFGQYTIVPSFEQNGRIITENPREYFTVSNIFGFYTTSTENNNLNLFAVNGISGKPLNKIIGKLYSKNDSLMNRFKTSKNGNIEILCNKDCKHFKFESDNDKYGEPLNIRCPYISKINSNTSIEIFTDLGVYQPGDTVNFVGVAHNILKNNDKQVLPNEQFVSILLNVNNEICDSLVLTSDAFGRIYGHFAIPKGGLNGKFSISIKNKKNVSWSKSFEVAEYKLPSYSILFNNLKQQYRADEAIVIRGNATSFSQIPIANRTVTCTLHKKLWWLWWNDANEFIEQFKVNTNNNGDFELTLPKSLFDNNDIRNYSFTIDASITSVSGETQACKGTFVIGAKTHLSFDGNTNIEISKRIILPITYQTNNNIISDCYYSLINSKSKIIEEGKIIPQKTQLDWQNIESGKYTLNIWAENDTISNTIVLYRNTDKTCPTKNALWVPDTKLRTNKDGKARILLGSNTSTNLYYIVSNQEHIIKSEWKEYSAGNHFLDISLPKSYDKNVSVTLFTVKDFKLYTQTLTIKPYNGPDTLCLSLSCFRDKVNANDKETWKFKFTNNLNKPLYTASILEVYNKAVDAIASNNFDFVFKYFRPIRISHEEYPYYDFTASITGIQRNDFRHNNVIIPNINMYNKLPFYSNRLMIFNKSLATKSDLAEATDMTDNYLQDETLDNVVVRDNKIKVAMWKPNLLSDKDGNLNVEFTIPNESTTWVMRCASYTQDLLNKTITREMIANKPIMVNANLPRFLRNGDNATINALVINNTEINQDCLVKIELFNPDTNKIISTINKKLNIAKNSQSNCGIKWTVTNESAMVGYRIIAATNNFSDGEQNIIPILEDASPIIESQPFFISPNQQDFSISLKPVQDNAKVTLEYCNNPIWYCITALPSIFNENSITATSLVNTLYSINMANGIINKYTDVKKAIEYWKNNPNDSTLTSMLERNQSLKINEIKNSPWLTCAQNETLQMMGISQLIDSTYIQTEQNSVIKSLEELQAKNGGWKWLKDSDTDFYTTGKILQNLGTLSELGFLNNEKLNSMIDLGLDYFDKEIIKIYTSKAHKPNYSLLYYYTYIRALFPISPIPNENKGLINKGIHTAIKEWKKYNLSGKALTALLLKRTGNKTLAEEVINSIKEFSIVGKYNEIYWDTNNIESLNYTDKISLTSLILHAISNVYPKDNIINGVREWLLLQKKSNNWGSSDVAVNAIYAILSTGNNWISYSTMPEIKLNNKNIAFEKFEKYIGYGIKQITIPERNSKISILRQDNTPAWGTVFAQYEAQMSSINQASTKDISITKTLYDIDGNILKAEDTYSVGDKIKVMLTVKNNIDMQYISIHDERSATMEPVDQLSEYKSEDNIHYYQEFKNAETNIFITYLPKGTHLISYDVTITAQGRYNLGIATIQNQYAPQYTAHSAGQLIYIK